MQTKEVRYKKEFFYKIGFYFNCLTCLCLTIMLIATSVSRDRAREMELFWRDRMIEKSALLGISMRQVEIQIDVITAKEAAVWDLYCNRKTLFKINWAKKAMEEDL